MGKAGGQYLVREEMEMNMRDARLLLLVVTLGLSLAFVVAPRARGQRGRQRHTCRQDCVSKYHECLGKEGADAAECEKALEDCRAACVGSKARPGSERAANANKGRAAEKAEAAEPNANSNANADDDPGGNANDNSSGNRKHPSGGSGAPPHPLENKNAKPPSPQP